MISMRFLLPSVLSSLTILALVPSASASTAPFQIHFQDNAASSPLDLLDLDALQGLKFYYEPGLAMLNTGPLSESLKKLDFPAHSPYFISQGGGGFLLLDQILIGGTAAGLTGFRTATSGGDTVQIQGGLGLFQLGYRLYSEAGFSLYPVIGFGSGNMSVSSSTPLNQAFGLQVNDDVYRMQTSQWLLDLGLGADYLVDFQAAPEQESGLLIGLKLGYLLVPSPPQWQTNSGIIGGEQVPAMNAQGPYIRLRLGLGTQRSSQTPSWF